MTNAISEILSIHDFDTELIDEIQSVGYRKAVKAGAEIIDPSKSEKDIPFVLEGLLKVYRKNSDGEKVLLYYLEKGETCSMSISCCLERKSTPIHVLAEEDSILWMIPNTYLDRWLTKYASFRRFVFSSYQLRYDELMDTIDSVVFTNMEDRLLKFLLDTQQATGSFDIRKTHQQIADELNTSRVVISRLLKKLENDDKIHQHRNLIEIL